MAGMLHKRTYVVYLCETQDQADKHVATIAGLLESAGVDRALNKYGNSKGWRRNRLRASLGFTVDALGLDTATRGIKVDADRPDFMILDDIDGRHDSAEATQKKIEILTTTILPAGSNDCAVLAVQNLIHFNSIFCRLADGRADFLNDRIVSGPYKAVEGLKYVTSDGRYAITEGVATWEGQNLGVCEDQINQWGPSAFLREAQHDILIVEGAVFGEDWVNGEPDGNVTEKADYVPDAGPVLWAIDDGYAGEYSPKIENFTADSHPRVVLLCQQLSNGTLNVFDESYRVKVTADNHIRAVLDRGYPSPDFVGLGNDAAELRGVLHEKFSIHTMPGPSSVEESVKVMRDWIGKDVNGIRKVHVHPRCKIFCKEMVLFRHINGEPWKDIFGHGPAGLRYLIWALRHGQ